MLPIKGLIEVANIDLLSSRDQMMKQGFTGLGPPDLVVLKKTDQSTNNSEISSHHIEGFQITSPSSFPAYFARIIQNIRDNESFSSTFFSKPLSATLSGSNLPQKRPKSKRNWLDQNRNKNLTIKEGLYCCWNSFANVDVHIKVCYPGSCSFFCETPNDEAYKISDLTWRELSICSALRFWRASTPLFASLFDLDSIAAPCLQYSVPPSLSADDLRFAVTSHPKSAELEHAILHSLIGLRNPDLFIELLTEFSPKMPHLLSRLIFYVTPKCHTLHKGLLSIIDNVYSCCADDNVPFVFSLVILRLRSNDVQSTFKAIPLLLSSLWNEPLAGIALSRICIALDKSEDALLFLNASSIALKPSWQSKLTWMPNLPVTKPKDSPKSQTNQTERDLFISPLSHSAFYLYRALATIAKKIGIIRLSSILKFKFIPSRVDSVKIPRDKELFPIIEPDDFVDDKGTMLNFLHDPGIECEPEVPAAVRNLPTSQSFLDAAKLVINDVQTIEAIKRGDNYSFESNFNLLKRTIMSLKLGDFEFASLCLSKMTESSVFSELLKMRLMCETEWTNFNDVFHPDTKMLTLNERNALIVAQEICSGLDVLASHNFDIDNINDVDENNDKKEDNNDENDANNEFKENNSNSDDFNNENYNDDINDKINFNSINDFQFNENYSDAFYHYY